MKRSIYTLLTFSSLPVNNNYKIKLFTSPFLVKRGFFSHNRYLGTIFVKVLPLVKRMVDISQDRKSCSFISGKFLCHVKKSKRTKWKYLTFIDVALQPYSFLQT